MLKLLTFDLDHTLWAPEAALARAEQRMYAWLGQHYPGVVAFCPPHKFHDYRFKLAASHPHLAFRVSAFRLELLRLIGLECGLNHEQAESMADGAFAEFYHERSQLEFYPDARETIELLAQHYPLIALTNGNADLNLIGVDALFKAYFNADGVGAAKPEPDMFEAALALMNVLPEEAMHIGDCPVNDVQAAKRLGMQTVWVNSQGIKWPEDLAPADFTVDHVRELPQLIGSLSTSK